MGNQLPKQPPKIRQLFSLFGYYSKPSFLIIGAQKAGTTALYRYLCKHPNIIPGLRKEIHYFSYDKNYFDRGIHWYHSHFPLPHQLRKENVTFEASPNTLYLTESFARMQKYNPRLKIIVLLRDPVARAYSAWNHYRTFSKENLVDRLKINGRSEDAINGLLQLWKEGKYLDFKSAIDLELSAIEANKPFPLEPALVRKGLYANQLKELFQYYPREQVFIIENCELQQNTQNILNRVIDFLNLPKYENWSNLLDKRFNNREYPDEEDSLPSILKTKERLAQFYQPHNQELEKLLGTKLSWSNPTQIKS